MKRLLCLLLLLGAVSACNRPKSIPDDKLVAIVGDLFLANAYWDTHGSYQLAADSADVYNPIFERYGYTPKDFMFTIENLSKRKSVKFTDIITAAIDTLQAAGQPFFDAAARRDSVNRIASERYKTVVYFDSLPHSYTRLTRPEEKPTIKLPLKMGQYKIELGYLVDTSDKNPYIQYMHFLSDSAGKKSNYTYRSYTKGSRREEIFTVEVTDTLLRHLNIYPAYTTMSESRTTNLTIDTLRVTYYIPLQRAIDSVTREILFKPAYEPPKPSLHERKDTENIIPLRLDTTRLSRLGDTVVRRRREAR